MRPAKIVSLAFDNLKQRKLRTSLTTLGVVVGIMTIIALAALGEGLRLEVRQRMESGFELNVLIVFPGSITAGLGQPFSPNDVNKIGGVTNVSLVAPLMTLPTAKVFKNETIASDNRIGAFSVGAVNFTKMQKMLPQRFQLAIGSFPQANDTYTIVFGYKAATNNGTAVIELNQNVTLAMNITMGLSSVQVSRNLRVAAILQEGGTSGITDFDYWAFIPTQAAVDMLDMSQEYYQIIMVQVSDPKYSEQIATSVEGLFDKYSISILVPTSFMHQVDNILSLIQIFLLAVASISLVVAGIGIMNIMTVSVMERTREIGILKAIGAKNRTVLTMFLTEATLIGAIGGIIGVIVGYGASYGLGAVISRFVAPEQHSDTLFSTPGQLPISITPVFAPEWTILAFVFAIAVCLVFGMYPARKAARLNTVEALRYE